VHLCRKVEKNKFEKLAPPPDFPHQGCFFFTIPDEYQEMVEEGKTYMFKFHQSHEVMDKETGKQKTDKRGKLIYNRIAIPLREMPFEDIEEANAFIQDIKAIIRKERI